jgi:hypothetical protein
MMLVAQTQVGVSSSGRRSSVHRPAWSAILVAMAVGLGGATFAPAPAEAAQRTVSARTKAWGWGVNGPVYAVAIVGDRVFVGGDFSAAVNRDGTTVRRSNLAAFSLASGRPVGGWVANASGPVFALASSASSLWVGGGFETIGGRTRAHLAKVSTSTGAVDPSFVLHTSGAVRALARSGSQIYAGGDFLYAAEKRHEHVVAADAATGAVDGRFQAAAGGTVRSLDHARGRLYVAGRFQTLNGGVRYGIGAVDSVTGALTGPSFHFPDSPRTSRVTVLSVEASPNGRRVYGAVGGTPKFGVGNKIAAWSASTGKTRWQVRLRGDGQAVKLSRGTLYAGFHRGYRANKNLRLLAIRPGSGNVVRGFKPRFSGFWGVRSIDASRDGLAVGGEFTRVNSRVRLRAALFPID